MNKTSNTATDDNGLARVAIWPKRIGLTLAGLAVLSFVWPQLTGLKEIGGLDYMSLGRIFIISAWVPLLIGIIQRSRFQKKHADTDQNV